MMKLVRLADMEAGTGLHASPLTVVMDDCAVLVEG
ncbi:hypothetical protein L915_17983 [Phytophthora nicotianae]|uniref:Uncharacterized protein n=1 Tax=Phytophthora nicotianae TaxID=4792 RepID=W2FXA5_PHYNI|nr:hypothetical protein L915_17983 [Phytophthora nicotianae]ETL28822.1 hypothetical protein L916_17883 [Phytophthora nicotianae]